MLLSWREQQRTWEEAVVVATSLLTGDFSLDAEFPGDKAGKEALLLGMLNSFNHDLKREIFVLSAKSDEKNILPCTMNHFTFLYFFDLSYFVWFIISI